jgi:hypothetical protein
VEEDCPLGRSDVNDEAVTVRKKAVLWDVRMLTIKPYSQEEGCPLGRSDVNDEAVTVSKKAVLWDVRMLTMKP